MNILVFGAGSIGSLFGALLSKNNDVLLIGRKPHVKAIKSKGLKITGETRLTTEVSAEESVKNVDFNPDLLILTVKSYDTSSAVREAKQVINEDTVVLSLQNGLDNIDKIKKIIDIKQIIAGVTTYGAFFSKPGIIKHTGRGKTFMGEIDGTETKRIKKSAEIFKNAGIKTIVSKEIFRDIWVKAIVNSSINPLTAVFRCKNGHLLKNPVLEKTVEKICRESTNIANSVGIDLLYQDMIQQTRKVIRNTSENYSSMFQSCKLRKKTEIDHINGRIADIGRKNRVQTLLNDVLVYSIKKRCGE